MMMNIAKEQSKVQSDTHIEQFMQEIQELAAKLKDQMSVSANL
jgi:hypothetical protein